MLVTKFCTLYYCGTLLVCWYLVGIWDRLKRCRLYLEYRELCEQIRIMVCSICIPINMLRERSLIKFGKPFLLKGNFTLFELRYMVHSIPSGQLNLCRLKYTASVYHYWQSDNSFPPKIQYNFIGSYIFWTMVICSRHGQFKPLRVNHSGRSGDKWG